jgi:hypothetical protein
MSLHNKPEYNHEAVKSAMKAHGLETESPSVIADGFRLGWAAALKAVREQDRPKQQEA